MRVLAVVIALVAVAAPARAEPLIARRLVLPGGSLELSATLEANLAARRVGEPLSLAPDLAWGVTDGVTVEVASSSRAVDRIDAGSGLCLQDHNGCARSYDTLAAGARGSLIERDPVDVAWRAQLSWRTLEPARPALRLGLSLRWRHRGWAITGDPHVAAGLAGRSTGNRSTLEVPLWLERAAGDHVVIALRTGVRGEIEGLRGKLAIPIGLEARVALGPVELGVDAAFPAGLGPQNSGKRRVAALWLAVRFDP